MKSAASQSRAFRKSPIPVKGGNIKRRAKVLCFHGIKVHDFLYHVASCETRWQDLNSDPSFQLSSLVLGHMTRNRTAYLYQQFLQACGKGPSQRRPS